MMSEGTKAVLVFLTLWIVVHMVLFSVLGSGEYSSPWSRSPSMVMVILFCIQEVIILALLYGARHRVGTCSLRVMRERIVSRRQRKGRGFFGSYVVGGLVLYFLLNVFVLGLVTRLGWEIPGLYGEQMVMTLIADIDMQARWEFVLIGIIVVVIGPIVEELVFRVFVTHELMMEWGVRGVVLSALLFALIHAERAVIRNLVILSLFLCYMYWKTGSAWYSFLFHVGINGLAFAVLVVMELYPELMIS